MIKWFMFYIALNTVINIWFSYTQYKLPKAEWNCFEYTNGQCTAYNFKGE